MSEHGTAMSRRDALVLRGPTARVLCERWVACRTEIRQFAKSTSCFLKPPTSPARRRVIADTLMASPVHAVWRVLLERHNLGDRQGLDLLLALLRRALDARRVQGTNGDEPLAPSGRECLHQDLMRVAQGSRTQVLPVTEVRRTSFGSIR
jgi:hypothetical protein